MRRILGIVVALALILPGPAMAKGWKHGYGHHRPFHHGSGFHFRRHDHHGRHDAILLGALGAGLLAVLLTPRVVTVPARPTVIERRVYMTDCRHGLWRYRDGTLVEGVACRQPDGSWRIDP